MARAKPIQKGESTHHHDQSMTLHNLRIIKVNPKSIGNDIPKPDLFEFDIL